MDGVGTLMTRHIARTVLTGLVAALICAGLAAGLAAGVQARPYHAPRTAFGQPDLQGFWTNVSLTKLERAPDTPLTFATPAEERAFERRWVEANARHEADGLGQGVSEWHPAYPMARIAGRLRTSWIISPANGRLPYLPEARARVETLDAAAQLPLADGPEARTPADRCLIGGGGSSGAPLLNPLVAGVKEIVQTRTEIAILTEMNHDVRIVRLSTRRSPARHRPPEVRVWMGDSIGWWQGDTLVVETTNFHPQEQYRNALLMSPEARVIERFTRVSKTEILYAFEVDDPATFTAPWRAEMPFLAETAPIYEFACHEGNYGLANILTAARRQDARP